MNEDSLLPWTKQSIGSFLSNPLVGMNRRSNRAYGGRSHPLKREERRGGAGLGALLILPPSAEYGVQVQPGFHGGETIDPAVVSMPDG